jgi:hypothetical protein
MKSFTLAVLFLLLTCTVLYAQTTEEEFNYITKGYKIQLESGLDMKKGYELKEIAYQNSNVYYNLNDSTEEDGVQKVWLKALYRIKGTTKSVAAYMIIYQLNDGLKEFYCIADPKSTKQMIDKCYYDLAKQPRLEGCKYSVAKLALIGHVLSKGLKW